MLSGEFYDSRDPELIEIYHNAKQLLLKFNNLSSRETSKKAQLLKQLFEKIEDKVWIEAPFFCDYGNNISIGENTFINMNCIFIDNNKITIGKNCLIAPHVQIYTASHPVNAAERINTNSSGAPYNTFTKPVAIGDNVWIGGNSVIVPGVKIGNNVTIGAGSVVTKDIPDNVVAFGNPCKIVKKL
ncbi:sugar O-acetyltransferase [Flexithrix dorotheae]|uniref:sugar O-acetyltransferase n=1 Tax=Flexithrix dorotheae TaxID=70993 RepID=UPI00039EB9BD|nr:sugar O-acetyltransferase [Flexithrix dorotheae]